MFAVLVMTREMDASRDELDEILSAPDEATRRAQQRLLSELGVG